MSEDYLPRVVHFSTSHTGGAGIAARRLNSALNNHGFHSRFIALQSDSFVPSSAECAVTRSHPQRIIGAALTLIQNAVFDETYFTLGSVPALNFSEIKKMIPDNSIIHVHNWFNLLDLEVLNEILDYGYQVVFTLHDMRLLTGGCHYSLDCIGYLGDCSNCPYLPPGLKTLPSKNLQKLKDLLGDHLNQVHLIAPSKWLAEVACSTGLIPRNQIHFIPNVHSTGFPFEGTPLRQVLRKKLGVLNVGIASVDRNSKLKGGDLLSELVRNSKIDEVKFSFLSEFLSLGYSEENFWEEIDYLLVSSRADNSPNVIHEAKLRNIPVIATKVGGITELLNFEFDIGIEASSLSSTHILKLFENLHLDLGPHRPRYVDSKYRQYVHGALESTIELYGDVSRGFKE